MPVRLDFKAIAESVDIEAVAHCCNVVLKREGDELRAKCPACKSNDPRGLEIIPETNSFRCWAAPPPPAHKCLKGDCIALYAHLKGIGMYASAKALQDLFLDRGTVGTVPNKDTAPATAPQDQEAGRPAMAQPAPPVPAHRAAAAGPRKAQEREFDPKAYLERLQYTDAVAALGIEEADAQELGIGQVSTGMHRGQVVFPIRWPSGEIAGFVSAENVKFPKRLLPRKVHILRRA